MPFKKLFEKSATPKDGLTQSAREAIVDALHFVMYADKHIAISEDAFIEAAARKLDWDANISYESYEAKSTGAVTRALGDAGLRADFLRGVQERLPGSRERGMALAFANDLARVDGTKALAESKALAELQALLK
jgi:hypothetical protein